VYPTPIQHAGANVSRQFFLTLPAPYLPVQLRLPLLTSLEDPQKGSLVTVVKVVPYFSYPMYVPVAL